MSMDWKEHDRQSEAPQGEKSKISVALIAWIVVAVLALVFILQNTRNSKVTFLFWDGIHPTTAGHGIVAGAVRASAFP